MFIGFIKLSSHSINHVNSVNKQYNNNSLIIQCHLPFCNTQQLHPVNSMLFAKKHRVHWHVLITKTVHKLLNKTMGKIKQNEAAGDTDVDINNSTVQTEDIELSYEEKLKYVNIIAKPMASKKLAKKIFKLIKKALKHKTYIRNGLKDVQSRIRRGERGLVIFAGDVSPVDIMIHLPGVCEDKDIPYCYVPSRYDMGNALGTKRGCLMVLIKEKDDYKDAFDECKSEIKNLALQFE